MRFFSLDVSLCVLFLPSVWGTVSVCMNRSENNGKVDVAMRFRRAWSAPAAPLSHLQTRSVDVSSSKTGECEGDAQGVQPPLPSAVFHLFPTQTCFSLVDVDFVPDAEAVVEAAAAAQPAPSAATPLQVHDALRAELQAAKNQILLLTAASTQSFSRYAALEAENASLRRSNEQLQEENESLKERLAQRDDEISEQLHLICDLEKRMEEFGSLTLTNKSTWNGRSGE